jgi:hypothetical protein
MGRLTTHETHRFGVYSDVFRDPQKTFPTEADAVAAKARMEATWPTRRFTVHKLKLPLRFRLGM